MEEEARTGKRAVGFCHEAVVRAGDAEMMKRVSGMINRWVYMTKREN
jgi:hypothetical protein